MKFYSLKDWVLNSLVDIHYITSTNVHLECITTWASYTHPLADLGGLWIHDDNKSLPVIRYRCRRRIWTLRNFILLLRIGKN
tara:strand:- start:748 stop:993 length:246 start_codon:yes stop_codon:yes gene_type:complete